MPVRVQFERDDHSTNEPPMTELYDEHPIGQGLKGKVYRSIQGPHVIKRFYIAGRSPAEVEGHRAVLRLVAGRFNVVTRYPYWSELFAWPDRVAERIGEERCLAVRMSAVTLPPLHNHIEMVYTPTGYTDLPHEERGWWMGRVAIAMKLARALAYLERFNLAHTDISGRNVCGDVFSGDMKLIDCDGIVSAGTPLRPQVLGTPHYMAPELVSGAEQSPSLYTDRHALAVFIYRMLLYRDPLVGPLNVTGDSDEADQRLLGRDALFIEHPTNTANRPTSRIISTTTLGSRMHHLFQRAFVTGLHRDINLPSADEDRPTAAEWEDALTRLYDRIVPCANPACIQRFFAAPEEPGPLRCSFCGKITTGPASVLYMRLKKLETDDTEAWWDDESDGNASWVDDDYVVVGWPGRTLHEWHLSTRVTPVPAPGREYQPHPIASFEYDRRQDTWYLRNESATSLRFVDAEKSIPPGKAVPLRNGHQIWLGPERDSRLAVIEIAKAEPGKTMYMLPEGIAEPNRPWPTLRARRVDIQWNPRDPITLRSYPGYRAPRIRNGGRRSLVALVAMALLGALAAGGAATLAAFWIQPVHALIGCAVLLGGVLLTYLIGQVRMRAFWGAVILGLCAQAGVGAVTMPMLTGWGALAGFVLGLLLITVAHPRRVPASGRAAL